MGSVKCKMYEASSAIKALLAQDYAYFDISERTGFLDSDNTASKIPSDLPESQWEYALTAAHSLSLDLESTCPAKEPATSWRTKIDKMLVIRDLSPTMLIRKGLLRRSHVVLCMLGHFYVRGTTAKGTLDSEVPMESTNRAPIVPESIAVPWILVSDILGVKPLLSYASEVLWNCKIPSSPDATAADIQVLESFTKHASEIAFDVGPARVEFEGAAVIRAIFSCVAVHLRGSDIEQTSCRVGRELIQMEVALKKMTAHLCVLMKDCEPGHFYWKLRPWIAGTGPEGWTYDLDQGSFINLKLAGSTAGTSSLLQVLDTVLGVHLNRERREFRRSMQEYMPRGHRLFVRTMEALHESSTSSREADTSMKGASGWMSIRALIESDSLKGCKESQATVSALYDNVIRALEEFRVRHFQIVTLFIINQAGKKGNNSSEKASGPVQGTGGSDLARLLKGYRLASREAMLQK